MGDTNCPTSQVDRFSFRINEEYDAELLDHLSGVKNRSKEIRKILRAGMKVLKEMSEKTSDTARGQSKIFHEKQKNQREKLVWRI